MPEPKALIRRSERPAELDFRHPLNPRSGKGLCGGEIRLRKIV